MKKLEKLALTLVLIISTFVDVGAQKNEIKWSEVFKEEKGDRLSNILYDDGSNVFMFVYNKALLKNAMTPGIMKLDASMQLAGRQDFKAASVAGEDIYMLKVFYCSGKFVMLTYSQNKSEDIKTVYATAIDLATLSPASNPVALWTVIGIPKRELKLGIVHSSDSSLFMIAAINELKGSEKQMVEFKAFDSKFNMVNEKKVNLETNSEQYQLKEYILSNDGNVYYIGKAYKGNNVKEHAKTPNGLEANYIISIMRYNTDGSEKNLSFGIGSKFLSEMSACNDPASSDVVLFLTYGPIDEPHFSEYETLRIGSKNGEILSRKTHAFSKNLIEKVDRMEANYKSSKDGNGLFDTFDIYETRITPDGRMYFILENDITQATKSGPIYHSRGIVICMHESDGTLKWMNYIPKDQWFDYTYGYIYPKITYHPDKVCIYYNDFDKNLDYNFETATKPPAKFTNSETMNMMMVGISNDGKLSRKVAFKTQSSDVPVKPPRCIQGAGNRLILYGESTHGKYNKIGVYNQ